MWQDEHTVNAFEFFTGSGRRRLIVFIDTETDSITPKLVVQTTLPTLKVTEFMYFITDNTEQFPLTVHDFEKRVQFGTIEGTLMESLLRLMQGVYAPIFVENTKWPDSVKKDFISQMHKFMAVLTVCGFITQDTAFQAQGHTALYVPNEDLSEPELCTKNKDLVQRLESLLVHWTRQIKEVVNNQHTSETTENSGPLEEIQFWRSRCDDLSGISIQLNRKEVQQIIYVLDLAKSSYLEQFLRLSNMIQDGMLQAQDNLRFLSTLNGSCEQLANAEPKNIPSLLPKLLNWFVSF